MENPLSPPSLPHTHTPRWLKRLRGYPHLGHRHAWTSKTSLQSLQVQASTLRWPQSIMPRSGSLSTVELCSLNSDCLALMIFHMVENKRSPIRPTVFASTSSSFPPMDKRNGSLLAVFVVWFTYFSPNVFYAYHRPTPRTQICDHEIYPTVLGALQGEVRT